MIILLIIACQARLQISSDGSNDLELKYSMANFGHFPYGRSLQGKLRLPQERQDQELDLCDEKNIFKEEQRQPFWYIARRGNCTFTTKAINAQALGAKVLIIVDNIDGEQANQIVMADDGQGFKVFIPCLMMSKKDGTSLIEYIQKDDDVFAVLRFTDNVKSDRPSVIFGLNIENRDTFYLLREFRPYYEKLKEYVDFSIYYEVYTNSSTNFSKPIPDCVGDGRYCAASVQQTPGADIIKQELVQMCIWQSDRQSYFTYMDNFDETCVDVRQYSQCSELLVQKLKDSDKIKQCVSTSSSNYASPNNLLNISAVLSGSTGISHYPGIVVNSITYMGNLDADDIFQDICNSMTDPKPCVQNQVIQQGSEGSDSHIWLIIFVIICCVVFAVFLHFCYKKRMQRQNQEQLGQQVNEMVSQYIKFYESKAESRE